MIDLDVLAARERCSQFIRNVAVLALYAALLCAHVFVYGPYGAFAPLGGDVCGLFSVLGAFSVIDGIATLAYQVRGAEPSVFLPLKIS